MLSTHDAFWIRYGIVYGRLLAHSGHPPAVMEMIAAQLEHSLRPSQHLAASALRKGYWRELGSG